MAETLRTVDYELVDGGLAWIHLARPERLNAVIPELVDDLCIALERAVHDGAGVAVLAGRGRAFCAGFDLKEDRTNRTELSHRRQVERIQDVTRLIRRAPFVVITAVHGYALGNGCEFALAGDHVIAADDTRFGFPEVSFGLSVTGGITQQLVLAVGQYRAKQLVLFGEHFSAKQAHRWGLVNRVVPLSALHKEADEAAKALMERPRAALLRAKRALDLASSQGLEAAFALEIEHAIVSGRDGESHDAIAQFGAS
jgi:enoyl-CoA hydratase/carnithine racemase